MVINGSFALSANKGLLKVRYAERMLVVIILLMYSPHDQRLCNRVILPRKQLHYMLSDNIFSSA